MKKANAKLTHYIKQHGAFALQEAISRGQYHHPDGLYFGGTQESWSAAMLKDVFREELRDTEELVVIDFHSGLGEPGASEMITEDLPGSAAYVRAKKIWGDLVQSSEAGESVSAPLCGTIDSAVGLWMKGKALTFAALEVGTQSLRDVFDALRRDNWLHAHAHLDHKDAKSHQEENPRGLLCRYGRLETQSLQKRRQPSSPARSRLWAEYMRREILAPRTQRSAKDAKGFCARVSAQSFLPGRKKCCALRALIYPWRPWRILCALGAKNLDTSLLSNI